jgi:metallo-beta-lactamase class B
MTRTTARNLIAASSLLLSSPSLQAQTPEGWTTPFPGHRVIGNLYAVGTYDLGVFLITSEAGHVLVNTGLEGSGPQIRANVEALGFRLEDVAILLTMQAHFDHTGALAEIKELAGAEMWATQHDAEVLADGGFSDPQFGGEVSFPPVGVDRILADGEVIELGEIRLTVHGHPGHTRGSASYTMTVDENGREYRVGLINMGTINPGKRLLVDPTYPGVGEDFAETYRKQRRMEIDVWVAAHGSQYRLHDKWKPGQPYDPDTFVDPEGLRAEVERLEAIYLKQIAEERAAAN